MSEWISVEDRLPEEDISSVFVYDAEEESVSACSFPYGWEGMLKHDYITHWMYPPQPPETKK